MHSYRNLKDKLNRYGKPTQKEVIWLFITAFVFAFILSFRQWGTTKFDFVLGIQNFIFSFLIVLVVEFIFEFSMRTGALIEGYKTSYKPWVPGLVVGLLLTFLSNGKLIFLAPGMAIITFLPVHRVGKFFYQNNYKHLGWIAMSGSIAVMFFAIFLRVLSGIFGDSNWLGLAIRVCIWIALYNMVPAPNFNGVKTFFGSRFVYVFVVVVMICCSVMLSYSGVIVSIIGSFILGALLLGAFFVYIEQKFVKS